MGVSEVDLARAEPPRREGDTPGERPRPLRPPRCQRFRHTTPGVLFFLSIYLYIILAALAGSLLLLTDFLQLQRAGTTL